MNTVRQSQFAKSALQAQKADTATSASFASIAASSSYASIAMTASYALTASYVASSSYSTSSYNAVSASFATTASYSVTSSYILNATSASFSSTASYLNPLRQNVNVYGNLMVTGNLNVLGTASFTYTTQSIVNVGAGFINLNTDYPAARYGGMNVIDSGSFGNSSTGSLLWDSLYNRWIYANPSGSSYDGGMLISGPRNTSGLGNEQGTTLNSLMKGQGGDHITSSGLFEDTSGNFTLPTGKYFGQSGTYNITFNSGTDFNIKSWSLPIRFSKSIGTAMSIENNGNILVGTTTDEGYKLDVSGSGRFISGLTITGSTLITASNDPLTVSTNIGTKAFVVKASSNFSGWHTTSNYLTITSSYNSGWSAYLPLIGIGQPNPAYTIDVFQGGPFGATINIESTYAQDSYYRAKSYYGTVTLTNQGALTSTSANGGGGYFYVNADQYVSLKNILYVTGSSVGIGINNPVKTLDVRGTVNLQRNTSDFFIKFMGSDSIPVAYIDHTEGTTNLLSFIGGSTNSSFQFSPTGTGNIKLVGNTLIASAATQLGSETAKLKVLSGYEGGAMNGILVEANGNTYTTILRHTGSSPGSLYIDATNVGLSAMTRAIYINGSSALTNYVTFAESGTPRFNISRAGDTTISGNLYKTVNNTFLGLYGGPSGGTVDGFIKINGGSNFWGMLQFNMGYDAVNSKMTWTLSDTTELMRLTGGGNLLLGTTTNTGFKLDVNGTSRFTNNMMLSGSQTIRHSFGTTYYDSGGYGGGRIYGSYNYSNGEILIQPSGSILTSFVFSPNNGMSIGGFTIGGTTGSPPAYGLAVSGSIGIGTRVPIAKLDVSGSGRFTNGLTITGSLITSGAYGGINTVTNKPNLFDANGVVRVDWSTGVLNNTAGDTTVDWLNSGLFDVSSNQSVDWNNRALYTPNNATAFDYSTTADDTVASQLYISSYTSGQVQRNITENILYSGHIIQGTIDAGVSPYDIMYLNTDGIWYSLKNLPTVSTKMLGIEVEGNILLEGDMTVSDDGTVGTYVTSAGYGLPVYLSGTTGQLTTVAPGSGVIRIVGHIYFQNPVSINVWLMKFRPSNDWT